MAKRDFLEQMTVDPELAMEELAPPRPKPPEMPVGERIRFEEIQVGTELILTLERLYPEMFDVAPVSRASVINFMKELEAWGVVQVTYDKAQGGEYRIYMFQHTEESLRGYFASLAENWAKETRNPSSTKTVKEII